MGDRLTEWRGHIHWFGDNFKGFGSTSTSCGLYILLLGDHLTRQGKLLQFELRRFLTSNHQLHTEGQWLTKRGSQLKSDGLLRTEYGRKFSW